MKRSVIALTLVLASAAYGLAASSSNGEQVERLSRIGEGVAVVFSPDLAQPGNRLFYERLGFAYFEDPSWAVMLEQLRARVADGFPLEAIVLETHGTNGHGLKVQAGKYPADARSYISVGALQEALEEAGVERCYLSACNAGRLLRPEIYNVLDPTVKDPLFLPATLGIIDASLEFDPALSRVEILRRRQSNLETLIHGKSSEFSPAVRQLLGQRPENPPFRFVVSTMLIQLVLKDPRMELISKGHVQRTSRANLSRKESERLFQRFLKHLEMVAGREMEEEANLRAHPVERARSK
jgi:hypothetical protein